MAVCALLSVGIIAATQMDAHNGALPSIAQVESPVGAAFSPVAVATFGAGSMHRPEETPSSTAPVLHASANSGSPFSHLPGLKVQRASLVGGQ